MRTKKCFRNVILKLTLFFLLISFSAYSQTYSFDNYTVQSGIVQSNVAAIVQDNNGDVWLGTGSGVSRFNGKSVKNYSTDDGLADNNVTAMLLDSRGIIWFAHANGTLSKYDGKKFEAVASGFLPGDKNIFALHQDKQNRLWLCAAQFGALAIINPYGDLTDKNNFLHYASREGLSEYCLSSFDDKQGNTWFLTDVGIKILNTHTHKFDFLKVQGMPAALVTSFFYDKEGSIWLGFSNGTISNYNPQTSSITNYTKEMVGGMGTPSFVNTFAQDSKGNIWASVWDRGIVRLTFKNKIPTFTCFNTSNGLSVNKIKCIANDREGNILLGTMGNGLAIFKGEKFTSFTKENGIINNQVWAVLQDKKGRYWWGTNEGITIYDPSLEKEKGLQNVSAFGELSVNSVRSMAADNTGNIWIGTWGGKLVMYDIEKGKFIINQQVNDATYTHISSIATDKQGKLWIGTPEGITVYDVSNHLVKTYRTVDGLSSNDVTCIFHDSKGNSWIGTKKNGITKFRDGKFTVYDKSTGLSYLAISCITENKHGDIWIGTEGGGLYLFHSNSFSNFKTKDGLNSDFITLLNVDENNNLWIGSNNGLNKFDYSSNVISSYSKFDGFTGIETKSNATFRDREQNIWLGTVNGVFRLNPAKDIKNNLEPIVKITRLKINLKDHALADTLELSYKENSLNIEYSGICFTNPDAVQYSVKLENFDDAWRPATKQAFEIYSNLAPGNYTFKVIACNNSGVWTEKPVSVFINIKPPFWQTTWFYVLCVVVGATLIFGYIKIRERKLVIEKLILEEKVEQRTTEIALQKKVIEEKNNDITASIRYAKRIQDAILPPDELVRSCMPKSFVLYKPKDIVSGDFYWLAKKKDKVLFAAVDCTGHGVPGAFMSIVGHNLLDQIISEQDISQPAEILDALNKSVSDTLRQTSTEEHVKDGMDIALCAFDRAAKTLEYAGAFNPLYLIRNGEVIETKADKFPIGNLKIGEHKKFTNHVFQLLEGDTLYVFSDGFADQFGGPKGKKLKYSVFKELLLSFQKLNMEEQGVCLNRALEKWRGELEQVDDILVIGTRM